VSWIGRLKIAIKRLMYSPASRDREQRPDEIIAALGIHDGETVVDLGSGTGYYTFRLARAVGPTGRVYAIDTDTDLLDDIERQAPGEGVGNLRTSRPTADDPGLPEPADLVFLSHVYHHLPNRPAYFGRLIRSLRPGGRVAIIEARRKGFARIFGHATEPAIVRGEMDAAGYSLSASHEIVPRESFQVFVPARTEPSVASEAESATQAQEP
jgi:predicted methyltransferase